MVTKIANHKITISIKAKSGAWRPKKNRDHTKLSANCIRKNFNAILTFFFLSPFSQTKYAATPIRKYMLVQTGAKIQLGGEKKGLYKVVYHVGIAAMVKGVLANPTPSQMRMAVMNLRGLFIWYKYKPFPSPFARKNTPSLDV